MIKTDKLVDELAKFNRRLSSLEKKMDLLYEDREILESIQGRLTGLEEEWKLTRQHDKTVKNDIKDEIKIANDRTVAKVETQVESIKDMVEAKKVQPRKKHWWQIWRR